MSSGNSKCTAADTITLGAVHLDLVLGNALEGRSLEWVAKGSDGLSGVVSHVLSRSGSAGSPLTATLLAAFESKF